MQLNRMTLVLLQTMVSMATAFNQFELLISRRLELLAVERQNLVDEMTNIDRSMKPTTDNQTNIKLLDQLEKTIWPKIIELSDTIFFLLPENHLLTEESKYQRQLRRDVSAIRYKAKARRCKSPDATYYPPSKRCLPHVKRSKSNPCPEGLQLYDGPDNIGICDCKTSAKAIIYSDETKQCHQLYTQGPCEVGQWWIVHDSQPECREVPEGCLADGKHVYWNKTAYNHKKTLSNCWKLNTQGPCRAGYRFQMDDDANVVSCYPNTQNLIAVAPRQTFPPLRRIRNKCPSGSYRARHFKCLV